MGTCWTKGVKYSRSKTRSDSARPFSTSPSALLDHPERVAGKEIGMEHGRLFGQRFAHFKNRGQGFIFDFHPPDSLVAGLPSEAGNRRNPVPRVKRVVG